MLKLTAMISNSNGNTQLGHSSVRRSFWTNSSDLTMAHYHVGRRLAFGKARFSAGPDQSQPTMNF